MQRIGNKVNFLRLVFVPRQIVNLKNKLQEIRILLITSYVGPLGVYLPSKPYPMNAFLTSTKTRLSDEGAKRTNRENQLTGSPINQKRREETADLAESLRKELAIFARYNLTDPEASFPYRILERKLNGNPLRAFFIKTLYEYAVEESGTKGCPEHHQFFSLQLPFILECIICIQYYHNQIYDRKGNINTPAAINFNVIDGNQFERQLRIYIRRNTLVFDVKAFRTVEEHIEDILRLVDVGQEIEKRYLTTEKWKTGKVDHYYNTILDKEVDSWYIDFLMEATKTFHSFPKEKEEFLKLYFSKIYLINAVLYRKAASLIGIVLNLEEEKKAKLERIATLFALMHQMVNDNGDFIPINKKESTVEKVIWDAFSDLKNENITLPIQLNLLLYRNEKRNIKSSIHSFYKSDSRTLTVGETEEIFHELVNSKAIYISMSIAKQLKALALQILDHNKPGVSDNNPLLMLKDMFEVADNNKYYRHYYNEKQAYKRYQRWKKAEDIEDELKDLRIKYLHFIGIRTEGEVESLPVNG